MKKIQVELKNYRRRTSYSDRSIGISLDTLYEMTSKDIEEIDEHIGGCRTFNSNRCADRE